MYIEAIGKVVAKLRKDMNITQDEIAKAVGVSAQAVSKWENGGVPDTELLPKIADFFSVSIDTLFGREMADYNNTQKSLTQVIAKTEPALKFEKGFELCWDIERALFGEGFIEGSVKDHEASLEENKQIYSSILSDEGFTRMGIANRLQYFLMVPETKNKDMAFFDGIDYTELFRDLSDKAFFDTMVFLNKRQSDHLFTPNLLVKHLHIDYDKALSLIKTLDKYGMIHTAQIEIDDAKQEVYKFLPTPSFTAMLIFARELIDPPKNFHCYRVWRNKPYLE